MLKKIAALLMVSLAATLSPAGAAVATAESSFLLFFGTSSGGLTGGVFTPSSGWTTSTYTSDSSNFVPGLAVTDAGTGVGVYVSSTGDIVSSMIWQNGSWGAPAAITASAVARTGTAVCSGGGDAAGVTFQDSTYHYWYLEYAGTWSSPQMVGTAGSQSYGPTVPGIAAIGTTLTIAFIDGAPPDNNYVAVEDQVNGTWDLRFDVAGSTNSNISPSIITLPVPIISGPELLMVYVNSTGQVMFTIRAADGVWSSPVAIINAFTSNPVALAPTANGGAVLAFRGTDTKLYYSVYTESSGWSTVTSFSTPDVAITTSPLLAQGIDAATAELVFTNSTDGKFYYSRLIDNAWTTPTLVTNTNVSYAAIASHDETTYDITISNSPSYNGSWSGGSPDAWTATASGSNVDVSDIQMLQEGGASTIFISSYRGGGSESGNISVNDPLPINTVELDLLAVNAVILNSSVTLSGTSRLIVF